MIGHYFLTALVNMKAAPFTTAARILCLAIGFFAMTAVLGVVTHWRSADRSLLPDEGRAVVVTASMWFGPASEDNALQTQADLGPRLSEAAPELKAVGRFGHRGEVLTSYGDFSVPLRGANADPGFLEIFRFDFVEGSAKTALQRADGVVLTEQTAKRFFGREPALGKSLLLAGTRNVVVTGVIGAIPEPTHFSGPRAFDYLSAMPPNAPVYPITYALLPPQGFGPGALQRRLEATLEPQMRGEWERDAREDGDFLSKFELGLLDVSQITEHERAKAMFGDSGAPPVATLLLILGAAVLAISCLNYANLAAAQAFAQARQTGMKRVLGAGRIGILVQSWTEAMVATSIALALAVAGLWAAAPITEAQTGVDVAAVMAKNAPALGTLALVALTVIGLSGLFPAFVLSRVRPVEALRSSRSVGGSKGAEQIFVGLQFGVASVLLVTATIMLLQNGYMRGLAYDPGEDPVIALPRLAPESAGPILPIAGAARVPRDVLRRELEAIPQVVAVTEGVPAWSGETGFGPLAQQGDLAAGRNDVYAAVRAGHGYFEFYGHKVLAGRVFSPARDPVTPTFNPPAGTFSPIVIDRELLRTLKFSSPAEALGKRYFDTFEIIGVVETKPHSVRRGDGAGGTFYMLGGDRPLVRLSARDIQGGLAAVRAVWERLAPGAPFTYTFEDDLFERNFQVFERTSGLFIVLTAMALAIAAIGLIGMAAQATQRRLHEVAVRKTIGSSKREVVLLLLADFSKPVVVASLIAWPLGYFAAQVYLAPFAQRIDLGPWPFVTSLAIALGIAWLAVGGQTFKAASVRPAQVLRDA